MINNQNLQENERYFLYIDILGFKSLVKSGFDIQEIYRRIDRLNVHSDNDFTCIVFSDTILVYAAEGWNHHPNQCLMWLIEFSQDLFYRLISLDVHIRAFITKGQFNHYKMNNIDAYYGPALIDCYEREKSIKCAGVFLDAGLASHSDIFHLTKYSDDCYYVHVMQHLDDISWEYHEYPITGEMLEAEGMEWWVAYLLYYLKNVYYHAHDVSQNDDVRQKYQNAWRMVSSRHAGLTQSLVENNFNFGAVVKLDWNEPMARIGTLDGAWG
jgi:hypothetical protein